MEQKNELSHRGKAARAVKEELKKKGFLAYEKIMVVAIPTNIIEILQGR